MHGLWGVLPSRKDVTFLTFLRTQLLLLSSDIWGAESALGWLDTDRCIVPYFQPQVDGSEEGSFEGLKNQASQD